MSSTWGTLFVIYYFCYSWISKHLTDLEYVSPGRYALTETGVILHYIKMIFWPYPLVLDYYWPFVSGFAEAFFSTAIIVLFLAVITWLFKKRSPFAFLGIWFFAILLPTSSFLRIADVVFDHRVYLSSAAVIILIVLLVDYLIDKLCFSKSAQITFKVSLFLLCFFVLGFASSERNKILQNPLSLWEDVVRKQPLNPRGHLNLGMALVQKGKINRETIFHFEEALRLKPKNAEACNNLGNIFDMAGQYDRAIFYYSKALELSEDHPVAYTNLAGAYLHKGDINSALNYYSLALRKDPNFTIAYNNLGNALHRSGKNQQALFFFEEAIRRDPKLAIAYNNLANVLIDLGRTEEAITYYRKAIDINPHYEKANRNLENLLRSLK